MKKKQLGSKASLLNYTLSQVQRILLSSIRINVSIIIITFFSIAASAQSRIAVVNGTTGALKVYSTLDSALKFAANGDYMYLPGGTFPADTITKKLYIFGAGINPDSSAATGITTLSGNLYITKTASGGQIEGCSITGNLYFGTTAADQEVKNYIVKRCFMDYIIMGIGASGNINSKNNFFVENIISNTVQGQNATNNFFQKNVIGYRLQDLDYCSFENNIIDINGGATPIYRCNNCTVKNNAFANVGSYWTGYNYVTRLDDGSTNLSYSNNIYNLNGFNPQPIPEDQFSSGNRQTTIDSMFVNFSNASIYKKNFRLVSFSPGKNMGTDGTDVGIFGTNQPTKTGWVPSNPHISNKNVAQQTDANGILKATFKVKAQNN